MAGDNDAHVYQYLSSYVREVLFDENLDEQDATILYSAIESFLKTFDTLKQPSSKNN